MPLNAGTIGGRSHRPVAKPRGKPNHRAKRVVVDKTAIAAAKAERARQEEARRLAEPKMVALLKVIKENRVWIAKAVEKLVAKRAAREAAETK